MLTLKKSICLTKKEAERICDLLDTLAAMAGTDSEDFTNECKEAQKYSRKIKILLPNIKS